MNPIKCIAVDDEPLAIDILKGHIHNTDGLELLRTCSNALEAKQAVETLQPDVIFLDISMPEITGLSFAKSLENPPLIVFTTAYSEYAIEGFELNAVDYLLKPISPDRFARSFEKVKEYFSIKQQNDHEETELEDDSIFVKANQKMIKIQYSDIRYVEAFADYVKIFTKERRIVTLQTMKNMEKKLPENRFIRVHRSFIVNLNAVDSYGTNEVMIGETRIPIGKNYKEGFMDQMKGNNIL
jgi:DNA-binding LytR/AlgR family response regulator